MRPMTRAPLAAAVVLALAAVPTTGRAEVPPPIAEGATVTGKPGSKVDLYRYIGMAGSRATFTLESPGDAMLSFYTPRGEEMLSATGRGAVKLEVVLPLTNAFLLAVNRADPAGRYTLSVKATKPGLHDILSANGMGFARTVKDPDNGDAYLVKSCWVKPGHTYRRTYPKGYEEITIGRDGMEYATVKLNNAPPRELQRQLRFEGTTAIMPQHTPTGLVETSVDVASHADPMTRGPFERYLCK